MSQGRCHLIGAGTSNSLSPPPFPWQLGGWCGSSVSIKDHPPLAEVKGLLAVDLGEEALQEPSLTEGALRRSLLPCWLVAPPPSHILFRINQVPPPQSLLRLGRPVQSGSCCPLAPAQQLCPARFAGRVLGSPGARDLQPRSSSLGKGRPGTGSALSKGWGCPSRSQALLQTMMPSAPQSLWEAGNGGQEVELQGQMHCAWITAPPPGGAYSGELGPSSAEVFAILEVCPASFTR